MTAEAERARPAVDVERAAIGWRVAAAGDEQDAANFAYDHMDEILADLARVTAERDAMVGVVIAARDVVNCVDIESQSRERIEVHINGGGCLVDLRDAVARLNAQQEPADA